MKIYCCQLDIVWENKEANFRKARALLEKERPERGSLFVLPEMFAVGFSLNVAGIAEGNPPETERFLAEIAKDYGLTVVAGVVNRTPAGRGLNEAVVFSPEGQLLARYAKIHPFALGGELERYDRGTRLQFFEWAGLKAAPFICYDLRFPEIFRSAAREGAEMFVVIADWPSRRAQHWVTLLQARAIENQACVIGVNRAGQDPQHVYPGRSMVIDAHGAILADAGDQERIVSAEIRPEAIRQWRKDFPALRDMHWRE